MASGERQGQLWSTAPRDWAELQEPFCRPLWQDTLSALGVKAGMRFLDAGCGGGGACVVAAALGCEVTGFDASHALLAIARERLPQAQCVHGDLEQLPFPDGHFDAALAANSVIFAEDIRQAMRELRRVVRPGGRVAVTSWGKPEQVEMRDVFAAVASAMPQRPGGGGPFAWSADGALANLITEAGFKVVAEGGSQCDFHYPDFAAFWQAQSSAGNYQPALQAVGPDRLRHIVGEAVRPYTQADGTIFLRNVYRWAAGRVAP
ncbi:MAG: methyltransferase domain-containing protein [Verrucomicrobia bacterium]|nr:methyltransferase domain-containing protein [Verrucomicrobiota bacterium]